LGGKPADTSGWTVIVSSCAYGGKQTLLLSTYSLIILRLHH